MYITELDAGKFATGGNAGRNLVFYSRNHFLFFFFACNFMSVGDYSLQPNEEICHAFTFQIKLNSKLPFISLPVSFFVTVFTSIVEAVILIIFLNSKLTCLIIAYINIIGDRTKL